MLRDAPVKKIDEKDPDWQDWFEKLRDQVNFGEPPSDVVAIDAATGIRVTTKLIRVISNTAGNVTVTANPAFTTGYYDGQDLIIEGSDDTKTVTLTDGNGVKLINGNMVLKENYVIRFHYNYSKKIWIENYRNKL